MRQAPATVSGTVEYRQRIALVAGAKIEITLSDVAKADAPTQAIGQQTIITKGEQVPIPFAIRYDPAKIVAGHTYAVSVSRGYEWKTDSRPPGDCEDSDSAVSVFLQST